MEEYYKNWMFQLGAGILIFFPVAILLASAIRFGGRWWRERYLRSFSLPTVDPPLPED